MSSLRLYIGDPDGEEHYVVLEHPIDELDGEDGVTTVVLSLSRASKLVENLSRDIAVLEAAAK